jgi:hypothetical protein
MEQAARKVVAVGYPSEKASAYPTGEMVADVAAKHVYGIGVPQRDFMGLARYEIEEKTRPIFLKMAGIASSGTINQIAALQNAAGLAAQAAIQQAIIDLDSPPNSPATIAAKGSSNPLIDTGHMKDSTTFVVRNRRGGGR